MRGERGKNPGGLQIQNIARLAAKNPARREGTHSARQLGVPGSTYNGQQIVIATMQVD